MSLIVTQRQRVRCPLLVPSMVAKCNVVPSCSAVSSTSSKSSWFCVTSSNSWLELTWLLFFNFSFCVTCIRKWTFDLFCWQKSGWGGTVNSSAVLRWIVKNLPVNGLTKTTCCVWTWLDMRKWICISHTHICREKGISALNTCTVVQKYQVRAHFLCQANQPTPCNCLVQAGFQ